MGRLNPVLLACIFLFSAIATGANIYSALEMSASDQNNLPISGVSFRISCNYEETIYGPKPQDTAICTTDKSGKCVSSSCFGCAQGELPAITARLYSLEKTKTLQAWPGVEKVFGYGCAGPHCCSWFDRAYMLPVNFDFELSEIKVLVSDQGGNSFDGVPVLLNVPGAFSKSCLTDAEGTCLFTEIPSGMGYGISAEYANEIAKASGKADAGANQVRLTLPRHEKEQAGKPRHALWVTITNGDDAYTISVREKAGGEAQIGKSGEMFELLGGVPYNVSVLTGESTVYMQTVLLFQNETLTLSASQFVCGSSCLACGCGTAEICSASPVDGTAGCCKYGTRWAGAQLGCRENPQFKVYFVPINAKPDDEGYLKIVEGQAREIEKALNIGYEDYVLVDAPLYLDYPCGSNWEIVQKINEHYKKWLKERMEFNKVRNPNDERNRVVGIDMENRCGGTACGFTYKRTYWANGDPNIGLNAWNKWQNAVYINAKKEGEKIVGCGGTSGYASVHELGHTFGLCDEYNPGIWEKQNDVFARCPNGKPTIYNSDLRPELCSFQAVCSRTGVNENEKASIMGSANNESWDGNPLNRVFNSKSIGQIRKVMEVASR